MAVGATLPAPDAASGLSNADYRIGPSDELDVIVFQEKDLSQTVEVDASGLIDMPLIGSVTAAGRTPAELAKAIAAKLGEKYLQSPHVAVQVKKSTSQKIIVDGEVAQPGVYQIEGRTTLQQAIALAKGADQYADLKHVTVFRLSNDRHYSEVYNVEAIRKAKEIDPEVFTNDVIVVQRNGVKSALRDYVTPLGLPFVYLLGKF